MRCKKGIEKRITHVRNRKGDRIAMVCNKDKIDRRIIKHDKDHFSEAKETKAHKENCKV